MELRIKAFHELTLSELYEILRSRSEIFSVEQNCVYLDEDRLDYDSLHVFYAAEDGSCQACLRIFRRPEDPETVQIGRVLTLRHGTGLGGRLLREGVRAAIREFKPKALYVSAQEYALGYYAREGFSVISEPYMEDGIPHAAMLRPVTAEEREGLCTGASEEPSAKGS